MKENLCNCADIFANALISSAYLQECALIGDNLKYQEKYSCKCKVFENAEASKPIFGPNKIVFKNRASSLFSINLQQNK